MLAGAFFLLFISYILKLMHFISCSIYVDCVLFVVLLLMLACLSVSTIQYVHKVFSPLLS